MKNSSIAIEPLVVDLSSYRENIYSSEDYPLFDEAIRTGKSGALRATYIMIWLVCAESLKRKFREAKIRDHIAAKIIGTIDSLEEQHKATDKLILDKAQEYGFLSDSEHIALTHVYQMRCVYGHPYEEAPSSEQVVHAAAVVTNHVLSKPIKLRHGFCEQLIKNLLEEQNYLDDQPAPVDKFVKDVLPRIDEAIFSWLIEKYWDGLEKLSDDPTLSLFYRRGIWFSRSFLQEIGVAVFSTDNWHELIHKYPKVLMGVCAIAELFKDIGELAQDSLVGQILEKSSTSPSFLKYLEWLNSSNVLTQRQQERFKQHVSTLSITTILDSGLDTVTIFYQLIEALKSQNWYNQNPAIDLIVSNGPDQVAKLSAEQQVLVGRNILQSAEGRAKHATNFIEKISEGENPWPLDVIRGIALESFTNENLAIRFKDRCLRNVLLILEHLDSEQRERIIEEIASSIAVGTPKYSWIKEDYTEIADTLQNFEWAKPLSNSLKLRFGSLEVEENTCSN